MNRLATKYLGLDLSSPLVASAGPLTRDPESARRLQESGAAAIVLPSLFEEEIVHEQVELSVHRAGASHRAARGRRNRREAKRGELVPQDTRRRRRL